MKVLGIIPARFGSTRFPGKPLAKIHGVTMIERVYRRAKLANSLNDVIVATDDQRIYDHVVSFGGKVMMTSDQHPSGTDRCAEVIAKINVAYDVVINIQGDEPYIHPQQIDLLVDCFKSGSAPLATLVKQITQVAELDQVNLPKVVIDNSGKALYFSRSVVPFTKPEDRSRAVEQGLYYKHIGIYGYRASLLPELAALPKSKLEIMESLEQLRWLENGYSIITAISDHENIAVDSPEDIVLIESRFTVSD
ncbi:MAG: 3-deoxy-manno-octulosonate cytidylyltransferase [Bacteroidia bacterium]|nr:3-deoxy-manno-octulosonate cytidylyltransferase [Bacteroidota bacterium]MBK8416026.1 3-deoxy-manno-octulosonate cytidylyltransferase [Bacteroidota bacterium]MBP9083969.1 3-deoxy-manno-octulosonate cytidylyltransferase [Bacteroidia bacterium]